ncbi:MAG: hypothetical protein ACI8XO_000467 [Verrucomicrobiales bacterium]|jgi:hypothetical protein
MLPMSLSNLLSPRMPDFIGIGAMRSGTSWLRRNLNRHGEIWMAEPKELHFFDRHFGERKRAWLPLQHEAQVRYGESFVAAPRGRSVGEFTPAYAVLDRDVIAKVRSWMPAVKLLFIMRDPVERAWSHARKDFDKYWAKDGVTLEEATLDDLKPFFSSLDVAKRGDYLACLTAWLEYFPQEQIWTGFMEDVAGGSEASVLRSVFEFLGVDPAIGIDEQEAKKVVNPRPSVPKPDGLVPYLQDLLYGQNEGLAALLDREIPWSQSV